MSPGKGILRSIALKAKSEKGAHLLGVISMLTSLFLVLAGALWILAIYASAISHSYIPLVELVFFGVPILLLFTIALFAFDLMDLARQRMYDLQAEQILFTVQTENAKIPRYVLYLRPFDSTAKIVMTEQEGLLGLDGKLRLQSQKFELEAQFADSVRDICAFVALGKSLEHEGAGRIEILDDDWQNTVRELMRFSRLIVIVPVTNAGTLWELDQIIQSEWVSKTLFLNVPEQRRFWFPATFQQNDDWPMVQGKLQQAGYALPSFKKSGQMIFFGSRKEKPKVRRLNLSSRGHLRRMIKATGTLKQK